MFPDDIRQTAEAIVEAATCARVTLATAESCTGGLIAGALTAVPGSSAVVDRGFVTYSNEAKSEMLGVDAAVIARDGAVSESVARAMAEGARAHAGVDIAISVTGIAGPGGGSDVKPVGLVHFACATAVGTVHRERLFGDVGREAVRLESVRVALGLIADAVESA